MWIYVLSFTGMGILFSLRYLLSITVLQITPKLSSFKQVVIISQFLWVRNLGNWPGWFWLEVSREVAIKMLARVTVSWRLTRGWRNHYQDGSFPWLLTGGLSSSPHRPLHRDSVSLWQGRWLPLQRVMREREREALWWGGERGRHYASLWLSLRSHMLSLPTYSIC